MDADKSEQLSVSGLEDKLGFSEINAPNSPGRLIEEEKAYANAKVIGGVKTLDKIEAKGVGVGMTKAFGAIGGVMLNSDEVEKPALVRENTSNILNQVMHSGNQRALKRKNFMHKISQNETFKDKMKQIEDFAKQEVVSEEEK